MQHNKELFASLTFIDKDAKRIPDRRQQNMGKHWCGLSDMEITDEGLMFSQWHQSHLFCSAQVTQTTEVNAMWCVLFFSQNMTMGILTNTSSLTYHFVTVENNDLQSPHQLRKKDPQVHPYPGITNPCPRI